MSKYGSKPQTYGGRRYDSIKEAEYAKQLDWRKLAGEIKEIIPQFRITIKINEVHICNYFIDFKIILSNGKEEYHEVKGFETPEWKLKWKLANAVYPEYEFKLIK